MRVRSNLVGLGRLPNSNERAHLYHTSSLPLTTGFPVQHASMYNSCMRARSTLPGCALPSRSSTRRCHLVGFQPGPDYIHHLFNLGGVNARGRLSLLCDSQVPINQGPGADLLGRCRTTCRPQELSVNPVLRRSVKVVFAIAERKAGQRAIDLRKTPVLGRGARPKTLILARGTRENIVFYV